MSAVDRYLADFAAALECRGRARRRVLDETRAHLDDLAAEIGEDAAARQFGRPAEIARLIDMEIATRRSLRATLLAAIGVLATGGSTLALINAADPGAHGSTPWTVAFFVLAQLSATSLAVALLEAATLRMETGTDGDLALLARRNACALVAAALTMFAAGGAVTGQASAALLLAGPVLLVVGGLAVLRTRRLRRAIDGAARPPLRDVARLLQLRLPAVGDWQLCLAVMSGGAVAAYVWDSGEGAAPASALGAAALEATAIAACFVILGRTLGLRADGATRQSPGSSTRRTAA